MGKNIQVASNINPDKKQEKLVDHFTVSIFLKSSKEEVTIRDAKLITINAQAGLLVITGDGWTKVYPILNIEHYEFTEHREVLV